MESAGRPSDDFANGTDEQRIQSIERHVLKMVDRLCDVIVVNRPKVFRRLFRQEEDRILMRSYLKETPERFVEANLVWPILSELGFDYQTEYHIDDSNRADFKITNSSQPVIGEVKKFGAHPKATTQAVRYLEHSSYEYAMTTDGLSWELIEVDSIDSGPSPTVIANAELRGTVAAYAREEELVSEDVLRTASDLPETSIEEFYAAFNRDAVNRLADRPR